MSLQAGGDTWRGFFEGIVRDDDRHATSRRASPCPTLIGCGTIGQEVPTEAGLSLRTRIAQSRLVERPGVDHFAFATRPALCNALVEDVVLS